MPIAEYVTTCGRLIPLVASGVAMEVDAELTMLTLGAEDLDVKVDSLSADFSLFEVVDDRVVDVVDDDCVVCSCSVNAA